MKKLFSLIFALSLCAGLSAQQDAQSGDRAEDLRIQRRLMALKMEGRIPLRFASALDGKPIPGARVAIAGIGDFKTR
jgi:hypothetical protein